MSYAGYRVQIGSTTISDEIILKGSYSFVKEKRVSGSWTDANGITHEDYFPNDKVIIKFTLIERDASDNAALMSLLTSSDSFSVTYWDDYASDYSTGTFRIPRPTLDHLKAVGEIRYGDTQITLEEM